MPKAAIFLNGRFIDDAEHARVSAFDAGFQHAVGLFETMLGGVGPGGECWALDLDEHMARLCGSAVELGLSRSLNAVALQQAVLATIERSALPLARVRLTITAGDLNLLSRAAAQAALKESQPAPAETDPTLIIVAQPATRYPREMFERGVTVRVADARANPLNPLEGHKTLNYWWRLRELQSAAAVGAAEAIVLGVTNHVCSGCVSNVLVVKDNRIVTPIARGEEGLGTQGAPPPLAGDSGADPSDPSHSPQSPSTASGYLASPVLPGVVRAWALRQMELAGHAVRREMIGLSDLLEADEVLLTNSSWGVLPVIAVESRLIGTGAPGPVGGMLRSRWSELVDAAAR